LTFLGDYIFQEKHVMDVILVLAHLVVQGIEQQRLHLDLLLQKAKEVSRETNQIHLSHQLQ